MGLILGSGLSGLDLGLSNVREIPYWRIPGFPLPTVAGHGGKMLVGWVRCLVPHRLVKGPATRWHGSAAEGGVAVLCGRWHLYEGYSLGEIAFPVRVMACWGVKVLVVTNAAGGANPALRPGDLMLIRDHINLLGGSPLGGPNLDEVGPRFPDMTQTYDRDLMGLARRTARGLGLRLKEGVYLATPGPNYETPAEVRMMRRLGADAIGMSTVPEVIAARHAGVRVLGISIITNKAAGLAKGKLDHAEVLEAGRSAQGTLGRLLSGILRKAKLLGLVAALSLSLAALSSCRTSEQPERKGEEMARKEDLVQRMTSPDGGESGWNRGVHECVRTLDGIIDSVKEKLGTTQGEAEKEKLLSQALEELNSSGWTLGPGNAALANYHRKKEMELLALFGKRHFETAVLPSLDLGILLDFFDALRGEFKPESYQFQLSLKENIPPYGYGIFFHDEHRTLSMEEVQKTVKLEDVRDMEFSFGDNRLHLDVPSKRLEMLGDSEFFIRAKKLSHGLLSTAPILAAFDYDRKQDFLEGGFLEVDVSLKNVSDSPVVLHSVSSDGELDVPCRFVHAEYGGVFYEKKRDVYVHDQMQQRSTGDVFYAGLLFPGDSAFATVRIFSDGCGDVGKTFRIGYIELTKEELERSVYVPGPSEEGDFMMGMKKEFVPYGKATSEEMSTADSVIVRDAREKLRDHEVLYEFHVGQRDYCRKSAETDAGITSSGAYFSWSLNAWVLKTEEGVRIRGGDFDETFLNTNLEVFVYLDEIASENTVALRVDEVAEKDLAGSEGFKIGGWDAHGIGYAASMDRNRVWDLLRYCSKKNYHVSVMKYYFEKKCLYISVRRGT